MLRTITAYSAPTHFTTIHTMHGGVYHRPEGVIQLWFASTSKSDEEIIAHCLVQAKKKGVTLGRISEQLSVGEGFYEGAVTSKDIYLAPTISKAE